MANKQFTGYLRDPLGDYASNDKYRFTHVSTTGEVIRGSTSYLNIGDDGFYDITLEYGNVSIESYSELGKRWILQGTTTINSDTAVSTLPALLNALVPATPDLVLQLEQILNDAETAASESQASADAAQQAASSAEQSASDAADSAQAVEDALSSKLDASYMALKIFQSPTDGGLTKIQTRTVDANEVYEVRKTSDDSLATIYSDAAGTTEIVQDGTSNVSDSDGVVEFYIANTFDELKIEIGAKSAKFKNNVFIADNATETGGVFIIYDDGTQTVLDDLIPISVAQEFKSGLALLSTGPISTSAVKLSDAINFRKNVSGELLSHSTNGEVLNSGQPLTYGESLLATSKGELVQYGYMPRGFVAPSSQLDDKFKAQVVDTYDYAFVRSVGAGAGRFARNKFPDDRHNLVRISLEAITEQAAKDYVDAAKLHDAFICFYTHTNVGYLPALMQYVKNNYRNITPSEWVGAHWSLTKDVSPKHTGNMLSNGKFNVGNPSSNTPTGWVFSQGTMPNITHTNIVACDGNTHRLTSSDTIAGQSMLLSQTVIIDPLTKTTPFCFSIYGASSVGAEADLKMWIFAKDSSNNTIQSYSKIFRARQGHNRFEVAEAFTANSDIERIQVRVEVISPDGGLVSVILDKPQLEMAGVATPVEITGYKKSYGKIRKNAPLNVPSGSYTHIPWDFKAEGENPIFDLSTGFASPDDGELYLIQVYTGLSNVPINTRLRLALTVNGVYTNLVDNLQFSGIVSPVMATWTIRGDGRQYGISAYQTTGSDYDLLSTTNCEMTITRL